MRLGCFALVQPFSGMADQFRAIREMGITNADLTDNHDGAALGVEYGFSASVSLDSHPADIRRMAEDAGVRLSAFCAHANLLDPAAPATYGTFQIIKAIRLAHLLGISHVITTEGEPKTEFGQFLTPDQRIFSIREKLYEPMRWAEELGIELLVETHGPVTDSVETMAGLLEALGPAHTVGLCLDTGNCWLGGGDPVDFARSFGPRIKHVHWKDMPASMVTQRGEKFGCGMASIALGDGVIDLPGVIRELQAAGFDGDTTLEIAGIENVRRSVQRLEEWTALAPQASNR